MERASDAALRQRLTAMRSSSDAATRAAALMALQDHQALAATARHTSDPAVYAFAWTACSRAAGSPDAHCQALSAAQWAHLDPGNAAPLLRMADAALERGDMQAVADALHRASLAPLMKHRELGFAALALADPSFIAATEAAAMLGTAVIGVQLALPLSGHPALRKHCARAAVAADANRRLLCDSLATLLTERGDTLLDVNLGRRIGADVGWPPERVELIAARQHHHMMNWPTQAPAAMPSCDGARWVAQQIEQISQQGEREVLEAAFRNSPVSDAQLIENYRRRQPPAMPARKP
jgi:hypothetical protein